jgi:hypothetical protein
MYAVKQNIVGQNILHLNRVDYIFQEIIVGFVMLGLYFSV